MSNIDTKSLVSGLMAVERRPQDQLRTRVTDLQRAQSAWNQIGDKLNALKTAAEALAPTGSTNKLMSVTSDDSSLVGVRSTGASGNTSVAIEVDRLASAHSVVMNDTFSAADASAGGRNLELTIGGTPHTFTSDDGSISGLARAINAGGAGVSARVLQTSSGSFQLAISSNKTGAASAFTVDNTGWTGSTVARAGADAQFKVDGVALTRSSNVVSDVVDGLELTLKGKTTGTVTVSSARDDDAIVAKVKSLVDAANSMISTVNTQTASNTDASQRGTLSADSTARRAADMVRDFVANGIKSADGTTVPASALGISLTRTGTLSLDEAALRQGLTDNPDKVLNALGRGGTSDKPGVRVTSVSSGTEDGPRTVTITRAAMQASMVGVPVPPPPAGSTVAMTVVTPNGSYNVSFTAGTTFSETAANLTAALRGLGLKLTGSTTQAVGGADNGFKLTTDKYGSGQEFSVSGGEALGLSGSATDGEDAEVSVTFKGTTTSYTANGRSLVKDGIAMSIDITADQLSAAGGVETATVQVAGGLAGGLSAIGAEGSATGMISRAKSALADRISDLQGRITRWDDVLTKRQSILEKRFSNMDLMLQKLQSIGSQLGIVSA